MTDDTARPIQLSVVLPVFNEAATLPRVLIAVAAALPGIVKEIILVDDGSTDGTREWIQAQVRDGPYAVTSPRPDVAGDAATTETVPAAPSVRLRALFHDRNRGKGAALQTGLAAARGDVIVVQDADLEYDPSDWSGMYDLIAKQRVADIVFGSRLRNPAHQFPYLRQYLANRLLSQLFSLLYSQKLTDVEVCYKMFSQDVARRLRITRNDFGCEIQLAAQLVRPRCWRIREVAIGYKGRRYRDGKKIRWPDGLKALWCLAWYRVVPLPHYP